jgi:transposase, IS6 family
MACPHCGEAELVKNGHDRRGAQVYRCRRCRGTCTALSATPFSGYRFPPEVIALAVRWYLRFRLSLADVVELLAERHIHVDRSTVHDWVRRFAPLYQEAARAHRHRVGSRWAVDETYIRVAGRPCYLYRAVDEHGQVVDVYYSERRDRAAAEAFFRGALRETGVRPRRVTTDKAAAYPSALAAVLPGVEHLAGKAEQQAIERDHQHLKGRIRCMRGFKAGRCAAVFGRAHAFMRNLRDGFYRLGLVPGDPRRPQRPRLALAWDELTAQLLAA